MLTQVRGRVNEAKAGSGAHALRAVVGAVIWLGATSFAVAAAPAGPKARPTRFVPLHVPCPEALEDGTPLDPHLAETLRSLATAVPWTRADGPPSTCHPTVKLTCGPDLDGDGDAEAIVQLQGWTAVDDTPCADLRPTDDHWMVTHTFLATRHGEAWRIVARLDAGLGAADEPDARRASFAKRIGGRPVVRVDWTSLTTESGCRIAGYEILELRGGALRRLELGDNSRTCQLCDCSP